MKVLVTAASKHGSTDDIAEAIANELRDAGLEVTRSAPEDIDDVTGFDAVVLGSAVYAGRWMSSARRFAAATESSLHTRPVWLFSSGPVGDPPKPVEVSVDAVEIAAAISAREHRVFAGKVDRDTLGMMERAVVAAVRAPEGDFRPWGEITTWARSIAETLAAAAPPPATA